MPTRREFLKSAAAAGGSLLLPACRAPLSVPYSRPDRKEPPFSGFMLSLRDEYDYWPDVEGRLPETISGTLYRNGPGLLDRGGLRKRALLDGDGMVQSFFFRNGRVRYRNRFVRTEKYLTEEKAGRFIFPTWSTQAPGGILANFWPGDMIGNQAGITALVMNGRLFAFDEAALPYELNPDTLVTIGEASFGLSPDFTTYAAHGKCDPRTGDWVHFGVRYGPHPEVHLTVFGPDLRLRHHRSLPLPRNVYMHDFILSDRHVVFVLHPAMIEPWGFLFGLTSLAESLAWRPEQGTLLMIISREGDDPPRFVETEADFMWHSLNAWEEDGEIVADFVGYADPDHFIGVDPYIFAIMEGREGRHAFPGRLLRYRIGRAARTIRPEVLHRGHCEWPRLNERFRCARNRYGYVIEARPGEFFWSAVTRIDLRSGAMSTFRFDSGMYCTEAVFVPDAAGAGEEAGWLLVEGHDDGRRAAFLAVLRADCLAAGPVATVRLRHHVPFSFHGYWQVDINH